MLTWQARDETSIDVMGCLNERLQEVRKLPLVGECAAARDAVGRVYEKTIRRLHGLLYETDIQKISRYALVQAQQRYIAVRPEGVAPHVHFRNTACFTVALMMAQAYELVSAYGCGSVRRAALSIRRPLSPSLSLWCASPG